MFHTYALLVGAAYLPITSGSVYPTQPTQATVWTADRPEMVSWIEDWKYPVLSEMGTFDVSLWCDTDTHLAQLASGVDPMTKTRSVMVPTAVLREGVKYTLRFTTSKPIDTVVYSADFTIVPGNGTGTSSRTGMVTGTGAGVTLATQNGTGSGFRTMMTTQSTGTASSVAWTMSSMAPPSSGSTASSGSIPSGTQGQDQRASSAARRSVDVEKLKFRFVFVIWPVLMGISMAL